jgi:hypothetical protein
VIKSTVPSAAESTTSAVNQRVPVMSMFLPRDEEERWFSPDETDPDRLLLLLVPYLADGLEGYAISRVANSSTVMHRS